MPRLSLALLLLTACGAEDLGQDIAAAYTPCSENELRMLTAKHAIQTVFSACGSNNFLHFAWAPNGIDLYFQLPYSTHVMNAEDKLVRTVPAPEPVENAAWLTRELLAVPTRSPEGQPLLSLYNRTQASLFSLPLAVSEPKDLQATGQTDSVLFTALGPDGRRLPYRANFTNSTVERAFPWMDGLLGGAALGSFTYTPSLDLVAFSDGAGVVIARGADGEVWLKAAGATRAVVHPEGRYIALEAAGEPISPFDQTTWEALSPEQRAQREAESQAWLARQRDWVPREVRPPVIDVYDAQIGKRARFTAFYGDRFQWYPTPYFASFVLWGLEGKEVNRNIALLDLAERLAAFASGTPTLGVEERESGVQVVHPR